MTDSHLVAFHSPESFIYKIEGLVKESLMSPPVDTSNLCSRLIFTKFIEIYIYRYP